jgi:hypothetical protein
MPRQPTFAELQAMTDDEVRDVYDRLTSNTHVTPSST